MTNEGASRSANIYVAIGNVTKVITVTQAALTLNLSTSSMAPHVDGQGIGYSYSSNSARTPAIASSNTGWLTANTGAVYAAMTYDGAARTAYVYASIGNVSRAITVTQDAFQWGISNGNHAYFWATGGSHNPGFYTNAANYAARGISIAPPAWMSANTGEMSVPGNGGAARGGHVTYYCNNRSPISIPVTQYANFNFYMMEGYYGKMDAGGGGDGRMMPTDVTTFTIDLDTSNTGYDVLVHRIEGYTGATCTVSGKKATVVFPAGASGKAQIFFWFPAFGTHVQRVYNVIKRPVILPGG